MPEKPLDPPAPGALVAPAAIFFDLDGTLCAPTVPFRAIFAEAVAPLLTDCPGAALEEAFAGWGRALLAPGPSTSVGGLRQALVACGVDVSASQVLEQAGWLNAHWAASQALFPDALATLSRLGAAYPLGLITNGPSDAQRAVIAALKLESFFCWLLVSGDSDVGVRKPDPAIFERAARLAGYAPPALLYIGDSPVNDVAGGAAAGWRTCWLNRAGTDYPSKLPRPDVTINTLTEAVAPSGPIVRCPASGRTWPRTSLTEAVAPSGPIVALTMRRLPDA